MRLATLRLVTLSEYTRRMRQRGFIVASLLLPLVIIAGVAVAGFMGTRAESVTAPIAYVDHAGVVVPEQAALMDDGVDFVAFADEESAIAAVRAGEASAAFVVAPDYHATRRVTSYSSGDLPRQARESFRRFLRLSLAADVPAEAARRAADGASLSVRSLDGTREFSERTWPNVLIPFLAAVLFFMTVVGNAANALQAVVDEKESRTMELVVTSISPDELMGGKILGLFGIGMTQLAAWALVAAAGIVVARQRIPELSGFQLDWRFMALLVAAFVPAYLLISGLLAAFGAMSSELREGQQLATLVTLPTFIPAWFTMAIISNPNGPLPVALTLFPLTAPLTLSIRWAFAGIPAWQVGLSLGLLYGSAAGAIFLAARLFRAGMLRYGRRLSWAEVRAAITRRRPL